MIGEGERLNPYVGLRPFDRADSLYFFGRRAQVVDLLQQLHQTRFLGVVGSSGCGKSSLIRAGLIPALLGGFLVQDRDRWLIAELKPGGGPIGNLALALTSMEGREPQGEEVAELEAAIVEDHARAVLDHVKPRLGTDANLLLCVDQFEEIFAFRGRAPEESLAKMGRRERIALAIRQREADDFVELLLLLAEQREVSVYVVLTMRSDFLGDCDLFYGLPEAMNLSRYLVPRLDRRQLREAIDGPARLMGQELAPRLVDALLNELGDRSDRLPILQHALLRSWDLWQRKGGEGPIDLEHYSEAGRLREALPRHGNEALREADLPVTARIFKCLTDRDPHHRRVRRAAAMSELAAVAGVGRDVVEAILRRFNEDGRNFLLISRGADADDPQVEITHESLIRQWDQLAKWVDEEAEARDQFRELVHRARGGRALLGDPDLQIALNWRADVRPTEAWARRYSHDAGDFDAAIEYLERSQRARTEAANRRRRRRNLTVAAAAVVGLALTALALWALDSADQARDTARVAIAGDWIGRDPTRAALLLLEVRDPARTRFAASKMREVLEHPIARDVLRGHEGGVAIVAFSPDGDRIVTVSDDGTARVWERDGSGPPVVLRGHEGWVRSVAFSPDGARLVTASDDGTARVWPADGGAEAVVLRGHTGPVAAATWSPDGARIATASDDGTARLWRADGAGEPVILRGHAGPLAAATWSRDGTRIVTASDDGTARVWNADGSGDVFVLRGHEGSLSTVSISPDGTRILTGAADGTARIWSADGSGELVVLRTESSSAAFSLLETVSFSPDGTQVLTSGITDPSVRVWSADGSGEPVLLVHDFALQRPGLAGGVVLASVFTPDGGQIVTGSADGKARIWNADGSGEPVVLPGHDDAVRTVATSRDGRWLVTGSSDGTARVWDFDGIDEPVVLEGHDGRVSAAAWSPDGSRIATASDDGTARVWSAGGSGDPVVLAGHESRVRAVVWSPDGRWIVTASDDGTARRWSADGSAEPVLFEGHFGSVAAAAFSPDGARIVTGSDDRTARVWRTDGSGEPVVLRGHEAWLTESVFSPDGTRVATASADGTVLVWDAGGAGEPIRLDGHDERVESIAFSPDGTRIVTASGDATARVWNADGTGEPLVLRHEGWVGSAAFSADGTRIVTASDDGTARVWSADGSGEPLVLRGHEGPVVAATFSPDGTRIVTGSSDDTARVWNADGSGEPVVFRGHEGRLTTAAFSPDGTWIVTGSIDGTARVWASSPGRLQQVIASVTRACLDPRFRESYLDESPAQSRRRFERCESRQDGAR